MQFQRDGKRLGRRPVVAMSAGRTCRLLFIQDTVSGRRFLCDTGAQKSVLPAARVDILTDRHGPPLQAANGSPIRTYGIRYVELCFGDQSFSWDFITAKVTVPLLGADFLCAYGLLVDIKGHRLIDAVTFCSYACSLGVSDFVGLSSIVPATDEFHRLLVQFPSLTRPTFSSQHHQTWRGTSYVY